MEILPWFFPTIAVFHALQKTTVKGWEPLWSGQGGSEVGWEYLPKSHPLPMSGNSFHWHKATLESNLFVFVYYYYLLISCNALVILWFNYCNVGLPSKATWKSHLAQNAVSRYVTPILQELHWLPVDFWPQFKMLLITFKALYSLGPGYLRDHLTLQHSAWPLR